MPPKKTSIGRKSTNTSMQQKLRYKETHMQTEIRQKNDRKRKAVKREQETFEENEARLTSKRTQVALSRNNRSPKEIATHQAKDRERKAASKEQESPNITAARQANDRIRKAMARSQEPPEVTAARQANDRIHKATAKSQEPPEVTATRQANDRIRKATAKSQEPPEVTAARQANDRIHKATTRSRETTESTLKRQLGQRTHTALRRNQELPREKAARQQRERIRHTSRNITHPELDKAEPPPSKKIKWQKLAPTETLEVNTVLQASKRAHTTIATSHKSPILAASRQETNRVRMGASRNQETPEAASGINQEIHRNDAQLNTHIAEPSPPKNIKWQNAAFSYSPTVDYHLHPVVYIGRMNNICSHCGAKKWKLEPNGLCCNGGKVQLTDIPLPPEPLKSLLDGSSPMSKHFLSNIRKYNNCFQMTSFGVDQEVRLPGYFPTFKVCGQVYHLAGSVLPPSGEEPKCLQIYFLDNHQNEVEERCRNALGVDEKIVSQLQTMLHQQNQYVKSFKTALEQAPTEDAKLVIHADKTPTGEHERRFNAPIVNEVAVVMIEQEVPKRDIVLFQRSNQLQRICETHRSYDPLQYPLILWNGQDGYQFMIPLRDPNTKLPLPQKKVSANDFYAFKVMERDKSFNLILRCKQLLHQFIVDMYAKIESERLLFIKTHQRQLRATDYIHLRDSLANDGHANDVGQLVILPSTFTGGPRYMHERTQDAMTYVRTHGRPDLFITLTCNPQWPEITNELMPNQVPHDRHDLLARVFQRKVDKLVNLIIKQEIFGHVVAFMYTIEWQKRGLPHVHGLFWMKDKIKATDIDNIISAELPDPLQDPILHGIVRHHMVHGPCGELNRSSPCMKDGKCTKRYPRNLISETRTGEDGYPLYRRRSPDDGGLETAINIRGQRDAVTIDNQWIVPYNPLLSKIFSSHINVEVCNSVKAIKYICKYINKGNDQAVVSLEKRDINEVQKYQTGRYICSNEAFWRIFNFPITGRHPTVQHLAVHLENGQRVYFTEQNLERCAAQPPKTTLMAFFDLCQTDDFARTLLYHEVPSFYTWDASQKKFKRRKQGKNVDSHPGIRRSEALGRVYAVHPNNFECFCLRLLLHQVRGPRNFEELRTINGVTYSTYRQTCHRLGLLEDDEHWSQTLEEATISQSASSMRHLFAIMLTQCSITNPMELWDAYKESFSDDIRHRFQRQNLPQVITFTEDIYNEALIVLEDLTTSMNGKTLDSLGLPTPKRTIHSTFSRELFRETNYDTESLGNYIIDNEPKLVNEQRDAYERITNQVQSQQGGIIFLDAPGGTGKTFLLNLLLANVRSQKKIALAVASSGIAATLLTGGRTAHSTFKLPLNLAMEHHPVCRIEKGSEIAKVLQQCHLIVWDECTMSHKKAFEALDHTLRDLKGNSKLMGGTTLVISGDFRQTLPVVPRGTPADELKACIKDSYLWTRKVILKLQTNMRAHLLGDQMAGQFCELLLRIGNGDIPTTNGQIHVPSNLGQLVSSLDELKQMVYPNLGSNFQNLEWLSERAILAPKNDAITVINDRLLNEIPGQQHSYKSVNSTNDPEEAIHYPTEFLNSLELPGLPPHNLCLKVGAPFMLLRNLDAPRLCNGTRLVVKRLLSHVIEATIITGSWKGENVFIPRIPLMPSDSTIPFKRLQFPVRLCFAITINKSQGQSMKVVGLNLTSPCFSHGQLYVGCSRVGSPRSLFILAPQGKTSNIVYPKALQ